MVTTELEQTVREMLADTLVVELEEVHPHARFFEDLGGESLDLLDLLFKVEKRYGVRPPFQAIASAQDLATDEAGRLTREALDALKKRAPWLNYSTFECDPERNRLTELLTVSAIVHAVAEAIQEKEIGRAETAI